MKVVVNRTVCSSFSLSSAGFNRLFELKGSIGQIGEDSKPAEKSIFLFNLPRNDKDLVQVVEELGTAASGPNAELTVFKISDNANWSVSEVLGFESIRVNGDIL